MLELLLEEPLFDEKQSEEEYKIYSIDKEYVVDKLKDITKPLDLKKYIM